MKKNRRRIPACMLSAAMIFSLFTAYPTVDAQAEDYLNNTYFYGFDDSDSLPSEFTTLNTSVSSVANGIWTVTGSTVNPRIYLNQPIDTDGVSQLTVRMKTSLTGSSGDTAKMIVFFKDTDMANNYQKDGVTCKVEKSNIPLATDGYVTYTLDLSSHQKYSSLDTITTIRIDIVDKLGSVDIDYIMLSKADSTTKTWDFTSSSDTGGSADKDVWFLDKKGGSTGNTAAVEDGVLKIGVGAAVVNNALTVVQMKLTPSTPIETADYDYLEVIMKHDISSGTYAQADKNDMTLYLQGSTHNADGTTTNFSIHNNNRKVITISDTSGNSCIRYIFPLSGTMAGGTSIDDAEITMLRLDPIRNQGTCEIDSIRLVPKSRAVTFGTFRAYRNGVEIEKFTSGKLTAGIEVNAYNETVNAMAIIAQFNSDSRMIGSSRKDYTLSGNIKADVSLDIEQTEGTYLKYFLFEKDTLRPLIKSRVIYPYSDALVENVMKMYPGFTTKAATFSFDDGVAQDITTVASLNKYGAKATFNVVAKRSDGTTNRLLANYNDKGNTDAERFAYIKNLYSGHEIANHSYSHPSAGLEEGQTSTNSSGVTLYGISGSDLVQNIMDNHQYIEDNLGIEMHGIAWPQSNPYNRSDYESVRNALLDNGYKYARYHTNSMSFELPTDWMKWETSGHIAKTEELTDEFIELSNGGDLKLLYLWGHSYEYADPNTYGSGDWTTLEENLAKLDNDNVWFATNKEVYDYVNAVNKVTQYANAVKNNSEMTVYVNVNGINVELDAGETYYVNDSQNSLPVIACWGDSLTYGQGSTDTGLARADSYPGVLAKLTGATVYNFGVPGETATTIAARQGALEIVFTEGFTIPQSSTDKVEIKFDASNGGKVTPRNATLGSWLPCTVKGVDGMICDIEYDTSVFPRIVSKAYFKRNVSGKSVSVAAGDKLIPDAQRVRGDINIIFSGTNGGWTANNTSGSADIPSLINLIDSQRQLSNNPGKYIVIGLTTKAGSQWVSLDNAMEERFGEHFLNVKEFLSSTDAFELVGMTPTEADLECIADGAVPESFLSGDGVHFNDTGYHIIAMKVHEKLTQLGYLN